MNNLRKYLILLELISFRRIDFDIIKKKYRELAMRLHPDITGRDTNKEMAEINNAYEFLIRNVSAANEELKNIWKEKEAEFARVYRDAILKDLSSATISQLRRSINLFNTIAGYKDVKDLITKYTAELNKKLKEEARKEAIYKDAILDVRKASIGELEKAISLLKSIPNYKDSNNLILIYKNQIDKLKEEIKQNESYYKKLHQIKNDSISDAEFNKIISFLNSYNEPGSDELLNHFYHRQNQFASVEKRLENERNEKIYVVLLSEFNKARTIKDFKDIISKYTKIKNYKNVDSILSQCKSSIENIIAREEYERKEKLYSEAIEYLKQTKDNSMLQKAIDLLKTIRDFKEAEVLIAKAVSLIFDNNEEDRKSKIYNKGVSTFEANDFKLLEDILKELNTVDEYKDIDNLKMEYQSKIDKLKDNLYEEAKIDIDNTTIDVLEKSIIILKKIDDYKDSNKLINLYQKKILSIKKEEEAKKKADLEEVYLRGLIGDDEEVTEKLLKDKIKILLSIQSYKESRKIIQSYKKYLSELQSERRKKQFKKYSLVFLKFYLPLLILIFIIFQVTTKTIIPTVNYNQGIKLFENGNYEEAIKRFNKTNKSDNIDKYIIAAESGLILESGEYLSAITLLESIGAEIDVDYDESTAQLLALSYISYSPKENGFSFIKWNLDDYELKIKNEDIKANIYLKAIWKINDYSIKFNSNGGTSYSNIEFNIEDDDIILPTPNKIGHTFVGWYNNSNFIGTKITSINKGSYENINLYAKWEVNKYDLILDLNDKESEPIIKQVLYGNSFGSLPTPKRKGYDFIGWYDQNNKLVNSSNKFLQEQSITIVAKWNKTKYTINFESRGGDEVQNISFYIDSSSIFLPEPKRYGYVFNGWYLNENSVENKILSIPTNTSSNVTLYAKWKPIAAIIAVDYNDGIRDSIDIAINFDDRYSFLEDITREHYTLIAWVDNKGNEYTSQSQHKEINNITIMAVWELKPYDLIININDFEIVQREIYYGQNYFDILGKISIKGYDFVNAYHHDNSLLLIGEQFIDIDLLKVYLKFEAKEFDLKIIYGDKEDDFVNYVIKTGEQYVMLKNNFSKPGYINKGFYDGGIRFYSSDTFSQNQNQTLQIIWELDQSKFKLTLKGNSTIYHQVGTIYNDPGVDYYYGYETESTPEKIYDNVNYNVQGTYYVRYALKDIDNKIIKEVQRVVVVKNIESLKLVSPHDESQSYMKLDLTFNKTIVRYSIDDGSSWINNYSTNISRTFPNNTNTRLNIIVEDNEGLILSNIKVKILNIKPSVSGRYYVDEYYFWPLEMWATEYVVEFTITGSNYTYNIYRNGSIVSNGSGSGTKSFTKRFNQPGSYSITVTDQLGNTVSYRF